MFLARARHFRHRGSDERTSRTNLGTHSTSARPNRDALQRVSASIDMPLLPE